MAYTLLGMNSVLQDVWLRLHDRLVLTHSVSVSVWEKKYINKITKPDPVVLFSSELYSTETVRVSAVSFLRLNSRDDEEFRYVRRSWSIFHLSLPSPLIYCFILAIKP